MVFAALLIAIFMPEPGRAIGQEPAAREGAPADVFETVKAVAAKAK
jgi:hypothetical protein